MVGEPSRTMQDLLHAHKSRFERDFFLLLKSTSLKSAPKKLREAVEYTLAGKNKRIRPILVLESALLAGMPEDSSMRVAAAFECLHTYSLVHDDLPAMDNDDMRRGQPSCHIKFGEATAILVGDLLQALSFECLASANILPNTAAYFARAVGAQGMVSGQFLDIENQGTNTMRLHRLKTGKLIEAAVVLPQFSARHKITLPTLRWARKLGLLFQITDDLLDATENSATLGKTAGKDAAQHKNTIVALMGLERARDAAQQIAGELEKSAAKIFPESKLFENLPKYLLQRKS